MRRAAWARVQVRLCRYLLNEQVKRRREDAHLARPSWGCGDGAVDVAGRLGAGRVMRELVGSPAELADMASDEKQVEEMVVGSRAERNEEREAVVETADASRGGRDV
ncbi:hypothetical protein AB5N19_01772 [Seiridium cardinale]|uniref:Uncharacterized protein n=1 Tax=Seiridium cardinale TaxID=138064 RepID=A0ABR2XB43_9PEZI